MSLRFLSRRKNEEGGNDKMFVIVGLGNPDRKYQGTRHNVGFDVIDAFAARFHMSVIHKKHRALIGKGFADGHNVLLVKPQTYMNLSGESVREVLDFYKVDAASRLIVISDDVSLDVGRLRIRKKGSAGGHNGLKNIILHLGHDEFMRMRIGVGGKPEENDMIDHVLGHFDSRERKVIDEAIEKAVDALLVIMEKGADIAMEQYNRKDQSV